MRVLMTHPPDPRPSLIAETVPRIDATAVTRLKQDLARVGCSHGLLFDANECAIFSDTYASLDADALQEDGRVATQQVLSRIRAPGRTLDQSVLDWLRSMSASWNDALPLDGAIAGPFLTNVVTAVSGSLVHPVA